LSSTGTLAAVNEHVGSVGSATFQQNGGTNTVTGVLVLGTSNGAHGAYNLTSGALNTADVQVGLHGSADFVQIGGTHTSTRTMTISVGTDSFGGYTLSGGNLASNVVVNQNGFVQN